ncbi:MAG: four helix bundle protein [Omnitrophica bacterium RIFCSPLOWO2_12_FULL_50_11]|nr:MAG: four helix bundle protein [Omnitrophica bacterium RIFCSPLOWO2_12_FULL_50_11]
MAFKFEKLEVWNNAIDFSANIHEVTRSFPQEELYILTSQMKRAADSIALNIAEGSTGQTNPAFRQFLSYAVRSGIELVSCLYIAVKRKLIDEVQFRDLYDEAEQLIKKIQALRNAIH